MGLRRSEFLISVAGGREGPAVVVLEYDIKKDVIDREYCRSKAEFESVVTAQFKKQLAVWSKHFFGNDA